MWKKKKKKEEAEEEAEEGRRRRKKKKRKGISWISLIEFISACFYACVGSSSDSSEPGSPAIDLISLSYTHY